MRLSDITADSIPNWQWTANMYQRLQELKAQRERDNTLQETNRRNRDSTNDSINSFNMGLLTGVPIPLTPQSMAGAAMHNAISSEILSESYRSSSSPSYDSGSSSSSYGSSSSSSSYDSGSSSSSSSSFD
jgi:hypothetical protein